MASEKTSKTGPRDWTEPFEIIVKERDCPGVLSFGQVLECTVPSLPASPKRFYSAQGHYENATISMTLNDAVHHRLSICFSLAGQPLYAPVVIAHPGHAGPGNDSLWLKVSQVHGHKLVPGKLCVLGSSDTRAPPEWSTFTLHILRHVGATRAPAKDGPRTRTLPAFQPIFDEPPDVRVTCSDGAVLYTHSSMLKASSEIWVTSFNGDWAAGAEGQPSRKAARTNVSRDAKEAMRYKDVSISASRVVATLYLQWAACGQVDPQTSVAEFKELYDLAKCYLAEPLEDVCLDLLLGIWEAGGSGMIVDELFGDFLRLHPELADNLVCKAVSRKDKIKATGQWATQMTAIAHSTSDGEEEADRVRWAGIVLAKLTCAGFMTRAS